MIICSNIVSSICLVHIMDNLQATYHITTCVEALCCLLVQNDVCSRWEMYET
jgi:hypothetical protein